MNPHPLHPARAGLAALLAALLALGADAPAPAPAAEAQARITVQLVTDLDSGRLASDLEAFRPVTETRFDRTGSSTVTLGEEAELWVRNAHVNGRFFFERYYQDKYIGRQAQVDIPLKELAPGEHVIEPGNHRFRVAADGTLSSADPDIRIVGRTVRLRLHRVTIYSVDGARSDPPEFRKLAADLGLFALAPDASLAPDRLPDPVHTYEPAKDPGGSGPRPALTNLLSHQRRFYPLHVWLPANQVGGGYVLYPSWQAFHLLPDGRVDLRAPGTPAVPGVTALRDAVLLPYRVFTGTVTPGSRLVAGVANETLRTGKVLLSTTLAPIRFRAGIEAPADEFFLPVDSDFSRRAYKHFLADNSTGDPAAIRLLALEWDAPVFTTGAPVTVGLRLLETAGKETLRRPEPRVEYSEYRPALPSYRRWEPVQVLGWRNGRDDGELRFAVPAAAPPGFYVFRVQLGEADDSTPATPLAAEIPAYLAAPGQEGTAAVVAPRGRTAFVAGEDVDLQVVLRSQRPRPAGTRTVVLRHPDGREHVLPLRDPGQPWAALPLRLEGASTRRLPPGRYTLLLRDLPPGIVAAPFPFDLAGRDRPSPFLVVKPSKYTKPMNALEVSHLEGEPVDLERAMATIADMGYTRVDLMTYVTNHHLRAYTWREELAAGDPRLPAPDSVFTPTPRDQILNACVREQLQFSDVWLSYNDFHLPRYIDPYIVACERWLAREVQAMRHSPAWDGLMLYDEMYTQAASGIVEQHVNLFPRLRARVAADTLGQTPTQIETAFSKYLQRPRDQRDPAALRQLLRYRDWEQHGWGDFIHRVTAVGRALAPGARFGTYHRTWAGPGANDETTNGWAPDLFQALDIVSHVHYADNSTCWVSIPLLAQALRTSQNKPLYVNLPLTHESRTHWDGQYQRHMAFALLAQGVGGISHWGLPLTFEDGPNPGTLQSRETTRLLNREILQPFGETLWRATDGYRRIGIVSTLSQHSLSQFKELPVACQTEGLWIACWRLGYPAVFLREADFAQELEGFDVIFVPGIRFAGELDEQVEKRLREAIAAGTRVVVEQGSQLELPGLTVMADEPLNSYYVGTYFATWLDDELKKVYEKSQPIVDRLGPKLAEWGVEPAARGPFRVGPSWRSAGDIQYLVMANFEDPDYGHAVKQQMAKPVLMPLQVPAWRGAVAYDLLAQAELPLAAATGPDGRAERRLALDMRRIQGALVAFLPERAARFELRHAVTADRGRLQLEGRLLGASGKPIRGHFPVRIELGSGPAHRVFFRVLGAAEPVTLDLPQAAAAQTLPVRVREAVTGRQVAFELQQPALAGNPLSAPPADDVRVPFPSEVATFLAAARRVVIIPGPGVPEADAVARDLVARLKAAGIEGDVVPEARAYRVPGADPELADPYMDGYHSWRQGQEIIGPATVVDAPTILLGGRRGSFLVDTLAQYGFFTEPPVGVPGQPARPSLQVAHRALHVSHDTLCLLANDAAGLRRCVERLFAKPAPAPPPEPPAFGAATTLVSAEPLPATAPPAALASTNELVRDLAFDPAGNAYVITWGHGRNLYSLASDGHLRFSRFLPEMGANRLQVAADRVLVHTAAGARVYQLGLDGRPLSQARLNLDPGTTWDDEYELAETDFEYLSGHQLLLHNLGHGMRLIDDAGRIVAAWDGEAFTDPDVSDEVMRRATGAHVLSPDGSRLAQLEISHYFTSFGDKKDVMVYDAHLVLRDLAGKLLHEFPNIENGKELGARLQWPAGAPGPVVYARDERLAFDAELKLLTRTAIAPAAFHLGDDRRLVRDGRRLACLEGAGTVTGIVGPFTVMPTLARRSPDGQHLAFLDEYGTLSLYRLADGALRARWAVPELGQVLRFTPASDRLCLGTARGRVLTFDLDGRALWQADLAAANDLLGEPLPLYDPAFRDLTPQLWPVSRDGPGQLDALTRLAEDRLQNGGAEGNDGWEGAVAYSDQAGAGKRSFRVGPGLLSQAVTGYLGEHVTWVLEFRYRAEPAAAAARLLAGIRIESDFPDAVPRELDAGPDWRFARVVAKSGRNPQRLTVGFQALDGQVLVDEVRLRRVRFPSINHTLYEPLHAVAPVLLDNPLFSARYDPAGNLRDQAPNRVVIEALRTGSLNLVESAFLQNGRLNDTSSRWYIQPVGHDPTVSVGLKEPRWISMVALYFDTRQPDNVTPHLDIFATDLDSKKERLVARVRHNGQTFRLVTFPPVKTPMVRLRLVNGIARFRTLCEVELYGPLGGREGTPGFADPAGQNAYMGDFSRVDRRAKALAPRYAAPLVRTLGHNVETVWNVPSAQVLAADGRAFLARAGGRNTAFLLDKPDEELHWGRAGGLGYTPYGALYGGLLIRNGLDGKLYCLNPDSGNALWATAIGERLFGAAVARGEDLYAASDTGRLYQIDLANGGILRDVPLAAGVLGCLAADTDSLYLITADGFLRRIRMADMAEVWRVPVAPHTDATPAVAGGVVYVADAAGLAQAVAVADGRVLWRAELGDEFTRCPVVGPQHVVFGCRGGTLAVLGRADGRLAWSRRLQTRFAYEPLLLDDGRLLYISGGAALTARLADGQAEAPLQWFGRAHGEKEDALHPFVPGEPGFPLSFYRGTLVVLPRDDHEGLQVNYAWHPAGGRCIVLNPLPEAPVPAESAKP